MIRFGLLSISFFLCSIISVVAQDVAGVPDNTVQVQPDSTAQAADTSYVYLLHSDVIRFEDYINPDANRLIGNVVFRHDSMYMYCDSALFYHKQNRFSAYHNVRAEQGDTLFLYGDSLFYGGSES